MMNIALIFCLFFIHENFWIFYYCAGFHFFVSFCAPVPAPALRLAPRSLVVQSGSQFWLPIWSPLGWRCGAGGHQPMGGLTQEMYAQLATAYHAKVKAEGDNLGSHGKTMQASTEGPGK